MNDEPQSIGVVQVGQSASSSVITPWHHEHCSTGSGPAMTWADVARRVFELSGRDPDDVTPVSSEEYAAGQDLAPRPRSSTMSLAKLEATGFTPRPAWEALADYLAQDLDQPPQRS